MENIVHTKHIIFEKRDNLPTTEPATEKRKKVVSQSEEWKTVAETHNTQESQLRLLEETMDPESSDNPQCRVLLTHLKTKQSGYRSQDVEKGLYNPDQFVTIEHILNTLADSKLACYYCKKWTTIFYEFVRDPRQWSLERLSNDQGHNIDNVVIACLECNMRRRTMYHERYVATKQLRVNKLT